MALVAGLLVVSGFAGGALTQRAVAAGEPTVAAGGPGVVTSGGGARRVGPGGPAGAAQAPGAPPAGPPTATGTIRSIEGTTLTLIDEAGAPVTVPVADTASVTTWGVHGLVTGTPVAVTGSRNPDGSIAATDVRAR